MDILNNGKASGRVTKKESIIICSFDLTYSQLRFFLTTNIIIVIKIGPIGIIFPVNPVLNPTVPKAEKVSNTNLGHVNDFNRR